MKIYKITERRQRGDKNISLDNCQSCKQSLDNGFGYTCKRHGKTTSRGICDDFEKHPDAK